MFEWAVSQRKQRTVWCEHNPWYHFQYLPYCACLCLYAVRLTSKKRQRKTTCLNCTWMMRASLLQVCVCMRRHACVCVWCACVCKDACQSVCDSGWQWKTLDQLHFNQSNHSLSIAQAWTQTLLNAAGTIQLTVESTESVVFVSSLTPYKLHRPGPERCHHHHQCSWQ